MMVWWRQAGLKALSPSLSDSGATLIFPSSDSDPWIPGDWNSDWKKKRISLEGLKEEELRRTEKILTGGRERKIFKRENLFMKIHEKETFYFLYLLASLLPPLSHSDSGRGMRKEGRREGWTARGTHCLSSLIGCC